MLKEKMIQNKPNVILMFVDDMGYGDLSVLNENCGIRTSNIDALAENGVVFTDCHATSSLCTPSRYGLLTGRYNWRSRLKAGVLPGGAPPLIEEGRSTLATLFKSRGYFTAAVGKWHLGLGWSRKDVDGSEYGIAEETREKLNKAKDPAFVLDGMDIDFTEPLKVSPDDYGFDYFFGTAASLDQPPYTYIENKNVQAVPDHVTGVFPLDRRSPSMCEDWQRGPAAPGYDHEKVIPDMQDKVLDLIDKHAEEPFFIYYPSHAVHGPLLPPEGWRGKSGLNLYTDMVLYVDYMVGQIVEKLKEKGIYENTIFIFASDNGCSALADYPFLTSRGHNPSYIFRGIKSEIYEGGHRIPLIISCPSLWQQQINVQGMSALCDLYATFAQLLGCEEDPAAGEDSFSLVPLLEQKENEVRTSVVHSSGGGCFSIRNKEWKLEMCVDAGSPMSKSVPQAGTSAEFPFQLYNMQEDVREQVNVAPDHPDICLAMMEELMELIEKGRSGDGPACENAGMDHWTQLEELRKVMEMRRNA